MRTFAVLLGLGAAVAVASAQEPRRAPAPQILTTATGEVRVRPDRATIDVGIQTRAVTAADAGAQNARKQRAIIDAIKARGVSAEDIATSNYTVVPEMRYREGEAPQVIGFTVTNEVMVTVRSIDNVGPVIDAALSNGANQVNSLSFGISNPDSARRSALALAVTRAKGDAATMAAAAGGSLGELIELTSAEETMPPPRPVMAMSRVAADEATTPIESGEQSVRVSVSARWRFVSQP